MDILKEDLEKMYESNGLFDYAEEDLKQYDRLERISSTSSIAKLILLSVFICLIVYLSARIDKGFYVDLFSVSRCLLVLLLYIVISVGWRFLVYNLIKDNYTFKKHEKKKSKKPGFFRPKSLLFLFFPDYLAASFFKNLLKDKLAYTCVHNKLNHCYKDKEDICIHEWERIKNAKKVFIELSNWINLLFTICIIAIFMLIYLHSNTQNLFISSLATFIIIRLFSRCFELIYAFYGDVVRRNAILFKKEIYKDAQLKDIELIDKVYINGWKKTSIRKPSRISLAIHSLFEVALLFSGVYFLFYLSSYGIVPFEVEKGNPVHFLSFFLYSISNTNSISNINFKNYFGYLQLLQVVVSLELILVSLATYLGLKEELLPHENRFFKSYEYKYKHFTEETKDEKNLHDLLNKYEDIKLQLQSYENFNNQLENVKNIQEELKEEIKKKMKDIDNKNTAILERKVEELGIKSDEK